MPIRTAEEIHANVGDFVGGTIDPDWAPEVSWPERWQIVKSLVRLLFRALLRREH